MDRIPVICILISWTGDAFLDAAFCNDPNHSTLFVKKTGNAWWWYGFLFKDDPTYDEDKQLAVWELHELIAMASDKEAARRLLYGLWWTVQQEADKEKKEG